MVKSCGCKIVEIGHAERYKYFNETDILVNKKIIQAIKNNLIPLVCFGEEQKIPNIGIRKKELIKKMFQNDFCDIPIPYELNAIYGPIGALLKHSYTL